MGAPAPDLNRGLFRSLKKEWCQMANTPGIEHAALDYVVQYDRDIIQADELWERLDKEVATSAHHAMAISGRRRRLREILTLQYSNLHNAVAPGKCSCGLSARTHYDEQVSDEVLALLDGHVDHKRGSLVGKPIWHVAREPRNPEPFSGDGDGKLGYFSMICAVTGNKRTTGETEWNVFCYECGDVIGIGQLAADYRLELLNKCHSSFHISYPENEWRKW